MAPLLPLPACHQGVYARLRRAMERVGVRGPLNRLRLAEAPPHPARKSAPTSPRKRGEVKAAATATHSLPSTFIFHMSQARPIWEALAAAAARPSGSVR